MRILLLLFLLVLFLLFLLLLLLFWESSSLFTRNKEYKSRLNCCYCWWCCHCCCCQAGELQPFQRFIALLLLVMLRHSGIKSNLSVASVHLCHHHKAIGIENAVNCFSPFLSPKPHASRKFVKSVIFILVFPELKRRGGRTTKLELERQLVNYFILPT